MPRSLLLYKNNLLDYLVAAHLHAPAAQPQAVFEAAFEEQHLPSLPQQELASPVLAQEAKLRTAIAATEPRIYFTFTIVRAE